jgi:hypothetical protein
MRLSEDKYLVPSTRRRLLVALLAVATAVTIGWLILYRPGAPPLKPPPPGPDAARCAPGQQVGCVGGLATVIAPPPASAAASRP